MLSAKRKSDGQIQLALSASISDAPFLCPECSELVILRRGATGSSHFAHTPAVLCRFNLAESEAHRRCKMEIYESLLRQPGVTKAALERPLKTARPDVSAYINGVPVAIEVQISPLSQETIARRTAEYARQGIYILWLPQWTPDLDNLRYNPSLWEKWIHAAYFGRIYFWVRGLEVVCYHFDPYPISVRETTWFSATGTKMSGGGYSRRSKRFRIPVRGRTFNLATDFVAKDRVWWCGNGITVPSAKLFIDRSNRFVRDGESFGTVNP